MLPPFNKRPPFRPHVTERLVVVGSNGNILVRGIDGQWNLYGPDSEEVKEFVKAIQNNDTTMDPASVSPQVQASQSRPSIVAVASLALSTVTMATLVLCVFGLVTFKACSKK